MKILKKKTVKHCSTCLAFWQVQHKDKIMAQAIPHKPWQTKGADIFTFNNKTTYAL